MPSQIPSADLWWIVVTIAVVIVILAILTVGVRDSPTQLFSRAAGWSQWIRTRSDYQAVLEGCYFDEDAAQRFVTFCEAFVVQVNGRFKGKPFKVLPWQYERVVGARFGRELMACGTSARCFLEKACLILITID